MHAQRIIGITPPNAPTLTEYRQQITQDDQEVVLQLGSWMLDRIVDFYEQVKIRPYDERPFHNCHTFANFVIGRADNVSSTGYDSHDQKIPVDNLCGLKAGYMYRIFARRNVLAHSVIGVEPTRNIGVVGDYNPLILTANRDIMRHYRGRQMIEAAAPLVPAVLEEV